MLYYARINDTTSEYDFEVVDVAELVQESIDRFRPQLNELEFDLQLNMPADAAFVRADHVMMVHVIDNIVDNAHQLRRHQESGSEFEFVSGARSVHVEIADHGEGIPADDLPHVFEKFYRRKGMRHRGAGLGLAIVRRIVDDHQGYGKHLERRGSRDDGRCGVAEARGVEAAASACKTMSVS